MAPRHGPHSLRRFRATRWRKYGPALVSGSRGGAAPATFSPSDVANLALWLKADGVLWQDSARTTPVTADNDPVGAWDDASVNARHAVQATAGERPTYKTGIQNGKPVVRFGDAHILDLASYTYGTAATICLVASKGTAADYILAGAGTGSTPAIITGFNPGAGVQSFEWFNEGDRQTLHASATGVNIMIVRQTDGSTLKGAFNGSSVFSVVPSVAIDTKAHRTLGSSTTGGADFYTGDICELIVYSANVSDANVTSLFSYLNTRWAAY